MRLGLLRAALCGQPRREWHARGRGFKSRQLHGNPPGHKGVGSPDVASTLLVVTILVAKRFVRSLCGPGRYPTLWLR
jgi:hypothetical protein